jgi:hypothetical protein
MPRPVIKPAVHRVPVDRFPVGAVTFRDDDGAAWPAENGL